MTSSDMHDSPMHKMEWRGTEALAHPEPKLAEDTIRYSYSKLCNLYFVYELAKRLEIKGCSICVNAFNPGLMELNFMPLTKASILFVKTTMPNRFGDLSYNEEYARELWETSKHYVKEYLPWTS